MPSFEREVSSRHLHPLLGLASCAVGLAGCPAPNEDGSDVATDDPEATGSSDSSGELPAPMGPGAEACATYCERREACTDDACDEEFCAVTVDYVQAQGEDCIAAYEAWVACLDTPPCEDWGGDELGPPACGALASTHAEACGLG